MCIRDSAHFDSARKVPVKRYAQHVLSEAERVDAAEVALAAGDLKACLLYTSPSPRDS